MTKRYSTTRTVFELLCGWFRVGDTVTVTDVVDVWPEVPSNDDRHKISGALAGLVEHGVLERTSITKQRQGRGGPLRVYKIVDLSDDRRRWHAAPPEGVTRNRQKHQLIQDHDRVTFLLRQQGPGNIVENPRPGPVFENEGPIKVIEAHLDDMETTLELQLESLKLLREVVKGLK